jgi:hypothetical protein
MDFFTLMFIVVVLSVIGGILWWVFVIWLGVKAFKAISQQMDSDLAQLNRLIQQAAAQQASTGGQPGAGRQNVSPALAQQIALRMSEAQRQLNQMDSLRRQSYETRMAGMQSEAASLGVFWTPPS